MRLTPCSNKNKWKSSRNDTTCLRSEAECRGSHHSQSFPPNRFANLLSCTHDCEVWRWRIFHTHLLVQRPSAADESDSNSTDSHQAREPWAHSRRCSSPVSSRFELKHLATTGSTHACHLTTWEVNWPPSLSTTALLVWTGIAEQIAIGRPCIFRSSLTHPAQITRCVTQSTPLTHSVGCAESLLCDALLHLRIKRSWLYVLTFQMSSPCTRVCAFVCSFKKRQNTNNPAFAWECSHTAQQQPWRLRRAYIHHLQTEKRALLIFAPSVPYSSGWWMYKVRLVFKWKCMRYVEKQNDTIIVLLYPLRWSCHERAQYHLRKLKPWTFQTSQGSILPVRVPLSGSCTRTAVATVVYVDPLAVETELTNEVRLLTSHYSDLQWVQRDPDCRVVEVPCTLVDVKPRFPSNRASSLTVLAFRPSPYVWLDSWTRYSSPASCRVRLCHAMENFETFRYLYWIGEKPRMTSKKNWGSGSARWPECLLLVTWHREFSCLKSAVVKWVLSEEMRNKSMATCQIRRELFFETCLEME